MSSVRELLGQPITWAVPQPATYEAGSWRSIPQPDLMRTGVVWSAGPATGTAWVIPDERAEGEGYAVCVVISSKGAHKQREIDIKRSTADMHERGLACLRTRLPLPATLARGEDGLGVYGYELARGDGEDPRSSYVYDLTALDARGTCPDCGRSGVPVKRSEVRTTDRPDLHDLRAGAVVAIRPALARHKTPGRGGKPCPGAGKVPAETGYRSAHLAEMVRDFGAESVA
jgi:hypothetical protein